MTYQAITLPNGTPATIEWVRDAPWDQHWSLSLGGVESARYATYTEARRTVAGLSS